MLIDLGPQDQAVVALVLTLEPGAYWLLAAGNAMLIRPPSPQRITERIGYRPVEQTRYTIPGHQAKHTVFAQFKFSHTWHIQAG